MSDESVKLLTEIRDLLVPIAEAARPEYERLMRQRHEQAIAAILAIVGRSESQLDAARMMDGTSTAPAIRTATKFDSGNFSKFLKRLRDAGVLNERGDKLALSVPPNLVPWPTRRSDGS